MASLTAHLRRPDDHARLAFHPECPLCRHERLAGALRADAILGRRTQAALAAGVLALASATPTAVLAAEPDQEQQGMAAPEQGVVDGPPAGLGLDDVEEPTNLPIDVRPVPEPQSSPAPADDTGPVEQEPATNDDAPVVDPGDGTGTGQQPAPPSKQRVPEPTGAAPTEPQPPSSAPVTPETTTPPLAPSADAPMTPETTTSQLTPSFDAPMTPETTTPRPSPSATAPGPRATTPDEPHSDAIAPPDGSEATEKRQPPTRETEPHPVQAAPAAQPEPVNALAGSSAPTTITVAQEEPTASSTATASRGRATPREDRFHIVRRGESLWSIATDVLGDGASAARIAREVNRLWELNSTRIGTGQPDLLMVGTRLALR